MASVDTDSTKPPQNCTYSSAVLDIGVMTRVQCPPSRTGQTTLRLRWRLEGAFASAVLLRNVELAVHKNGHDLGSWESRDKARRRATQVDARAKHPWAAGSACSRSASPLRCDKGLPDLDSIPRTARTCSRFQGNHPSHSNRRLRAVQTDLQRFEGTISARNRWPRNLSNIGRGA